MYDVRSDRAKLVREYQYEQRALRRRIRDESAYRKDFEDQPGWADRDADLEPWPESIALSLNPVQHEALDVAATFVGATPQEVVRGLINQYLVSELLLDDRT